MPQEATVKRSDTRVHGFKNPEMDFQLMRQLGSAAYGGASLGECLNAAKMIADGSPADWVNVFAAMAKRQKGDAARRAAKKHAQSAYNQYLEASNSYRAAEYFAPIDSEEHRALGLNSREAFLQAMSFAEHYFEVDDYEFEGKRLPAYFFSPDSTGKQRKTLVLISGYDGTLEEIYIAQGRAALARDYNVFVFAAPGQMDIWRTYQDLPFRPDYEKAASAALNQLWKRSHCLIPSKIAFYGISMGGYFAMRAAGSDDRIKAVILNSPIVNWGEYLAAGGFKVESPEEEDFSIDDLPHIPDAEFPPLLKEMTKSVIFRFGCRTFHETYHKLQTFDARDAIKKITCPALALIGEGEGDEAIKQAREFTENTAGPVTEYCFTEEEGADAHCQVTNLMLSNAVVFDWLDELFD